MLEKTGKRELAWLFAGILCYEIFIQNTDMVEIIVWPFVTYIAAASGLHIYGRMQRDQGSVVPDRRRPQRSGQRAGREDEYPDSRTNEEFRSYRKRETEGKG